LPIEDPVFVGRKKYPSQKDAAKAHGLSVKKVMARLNLGWTKKQAYGLCSPTKLSAGSIAVEGKEYPTQKEASKAYGLNHQTVSTRISRGWTKRQAYGIDSPPRYKVSG